MKTGMRVFVGMLAGLALLVSPAVMADGVDVESSRPAAKKVGKAGKEMTRQELQESLELMRSLIEVEREKVRLLEESKARQDEELSAMKGLLENLSKDVTALRTGQEQIEGEVIPGEIKKLETTTLKKQDDRLVKLEKDKSPIKWRGDFRYRYETFTMDDEFDGRGRNSTNVTRIRFGGTVAFNDELTGSFRVGITQPTRQDASGNTTFNMDTGLITKKNVFGGEVGVGRSKESLGNNLLLCNYVDGVRYKARWGEHWGFTGMLLTENRGSGLVSNSVTHGLQANVAAVQYRPGASHTVLLSTLGNGSEDDKYGVTSPKTHERWYALDLNGKIRPRWEYWASTLLYTNELDGNDVAANQQYLRGDTENRAHLLGVGYEETRKWYGRLMWAAMEDNFRTFDMATDFQYNNDNHHPMEELLQGLAIRARNGRNGRSEGLFPPNLAAALPNATPIARAGESRGSGDFHGYRDVQLKAGVFLGRKKDFELTVTQDWLVPVQGSYGYKDLDSTAVRLRYQYDAKTHWDVRFLKLTSEYGRDVTDLRTELYSKF